MRGQYSIKEKFRENDTEVRRAENKLYQGKQYNFSIAESYRKAGWKN